METNYWRTLLAVLDSGSFSRAAKDLNISQSAVSQRINFMEAQYGFPLIYRSGGVIAETDAGKAVRKKARQILLLEKDLQSELNSLGKKMNISFCCTPAFGIVYLPWVLSRFFQTDAATVNLRSAIHAPDDALKSVLNNECDVAVIEHCGNLGELDAISFSLAPDELTFVSAPSLRLSGREVSLDEMMSNRLIVRREGCSSRCLLEVNLMAHDKTIDDFQGVSVHNDLNMMIQSARAGHGVAFVSKSLVKGDIEKGLLIEHKLQNFQNYRSRTMIINKMCGENELVKGFVECVNYVLSIDLMPLP